MTSEYRTAELSRAKAEYAKWRAVYDSTPWEGRKNRATKMKAADEMEFWSNKMAFLENAK